MRQLWRTAQPGILAGLLNLAATVHHRLETIVVDDAPRMADFGRVLACVDEVLSSDGLRRYGSRSDQLSEDSLSGIPFVEQLRHRIREPLRSQSGADLLTLVTPTRDDWHRPKDWPRNGREVTSLLRRHAPALRRLGWAIEDDAARNHRNVLQWTIYPPSKDVAAHRASQPSRPSLLRPGPSAGSAPEHPATSLIDGHRDDLSA